MTTRSATTPFPARIKSELQIDPVLLTIVVALLLGGFVILASASISISGSVSNNPFFHLQRQRIVAALGTAAGCVGGCGRTSAAAAGRHAHRSCSAVPMEGAPAMGARGECGPRFSSGGRDRTAPVPRPRFARRSATASACATRRRRLGQPARTRACGAGRVSVARWCRSASVADRR